MEGQREKGDDEGMEGEMQEWQSWDPAANHG